MYSNERDSRKDKRETPKPHDVTVPARQPRSRNKKSDDVTSRKSRVVMNKIVDCTWSVQTKDDMPLPPRKKAKKILTSSFELASQKKSHAEDAVRAKFENSEKDVRSQSPEESMVFSQRQKDILTIEPPGGTVRNYHLFVPNQMWKGSYNNRKTSVNVTSRREKETSRDK